jgi:hypothetical protein
MENPLYLALPITRLRIPSACLSFTLRTLAINFSALAGNVCVSRHSSGAGLRLCMPVRQHLGRAPEILGPQASFSQNRCHLCAFEF